MSWLIILDLLKVLRSCYLQVTPRQRVSWNHTATLPMKSQSHEVHDSNLRALTCTELSRWPIFLGRHWHNCRLQLIHRMVLGERSNNCSLNVYYKSSQWYRCQPACLHNRRVYMTPMMVPGYNQTRQWMLWTQIFMNACGRTERMCRSINNSTARKHSTGIWLLLLN